MTTDAHERTMQVYRRGHDDASNWAANDMRHNMAQATKTTAGTHCDDYGH